MVENANEILCPKCGSNQITANQKGFSGSKAVAGALLTGGVGLLAGTIGSKNVIITCLSCGKQFKPGEGKNQAKAKRDSARPATRGEIKAAKILAIVCLVVIVPSTMLLFVYGDTGLGFMFLIISLIFLLIATRKVPEKTIHNKIK